MTPGAVRSRRSTSSPPRHRWGSRCGCPRREAFPSEAMQRVPRGRSRPAYVCRPGSNADHGLRIFTRSGELPVAQHRSAVPAHARLESAALLANGVVVHESPLGLIRVRDHERGRVRLPFRLAAAASTTPAVAPSASLRSRAAEPGRPSGSALACPIQQRQASPTTMGRIRRQPEPTERAGQFPQEDLTRSRRGRA